MKLFYVLLDGYPVIVFNKKDGAKKAIEMIKKKYFLTDHDIKKHYSILEHEIEEV